MELVTSGASPINGAEPSCVDPAMTCRLFSGLARSIGLLSNIIIDRVYFGRFRG